MPANAATPPPGSAGVDVGGLVLTVTHWPTLLQYWSSVLHVPQAIDPHAGSVYVPHWTPVQILGLARVQHSYPVTT
jgi:hypothetical protein